jgi:hypothetical protein
VVFHFVPFAFAYSPGIIRLTFDETHYSRCRAISSFSRHVSDIKHWNGDFAGAKSLGIYKLEDDELTICYDAESQGRQSEFESPAKTQRKLLTFKRVKP